MTRRVAVAVFAIGFVFAGCGSDSTRTSAPIPPSATAGAESQPPTPTTSATQAPPTEAGPAEPCASGPACAMPAGEYAVSSLAGEFNVRLSGDSWSLVAYTPEILSLRAGAEWIAFMSGEIRLREGDEIEMTSKAQRAQKFLANLPGISVTAIEQPQQVGGFDAVVFDLSNKGEQTTLLWGLGNTSGMYTLDPGASVRMLWADVDGTPFVIALEAPTPELPAFIEDVAGVVQSVVFD